MSERDPQAICDEWNAKYPVGTKVRAKLTSGEVVDGVTVEQADNTLSGEARVLVRRADDKPPTYWPLVTNTTPIVPEPTPQEQCDAFNARVKVGDVVTVHHEYSTYDTVTLDRAKVSKLDLPRVHVKDRNGWEQWMELRRVRPKPKSPAQLACDAFNARVKVGDTVEACWLCVPFLTHTVGPAIVKDGAACVFLGNCSGKFPFLLDNVRPVERAKAAKPAEPTLDDLIREAVKTLPKDYRAEIHIQGGKVTGLTKGIDEGLGPRRSFHWNDASWQDSRSESPWDAARRKLTRRFDDLNAVPTTEQPK